MKKRLKLIVSLLIPVLIGFVASYFTTGSIDSGWYGSLEKASFNPPDFVFGPVWTTLYLLIGFSYFLVWCNSKNSVFKLATIVYFVQLGLNFLWSIIFFGLKDPLLAFFEIIVLAAFIILNIYYFYKIDKTAAYLLVPYLLWVSFAMALNFFIVYLN